MKPIKFNGVNVMLGKDQPEYQDLPALFDKEYNGTFVTCWELTESELDLVTKTRRIWVSQMSFDRPFSPQLVSASPLATGNEPEEYPAEFGQTLLKIIPVIEGKGDESKVTSVQINMQATFDTGLVDEMGKLTNNGIVSITSILTSAIVAHIKGCDKVGKIKTAHHIKTVVDMIETGVFDAESKLKVMGGMSIVKDDEEEKCDGDISKCAICERTCLMK